MNSETRKKITALCVFALPVIMVQITSSLLSDAGPNVAAAASAKQIPIKEIPPVATLSKPDDASLAASKHVAFLLTQPFGSTPFHYRSETVQATSVNQSMPDIIVQMIMVTKNGNVATIAGEEYRVGDKLKKSKWVVTTIDGQNQSVTVIDSSTGKSITSYQQR